MSTSLPVEAVIRQFSPILADRARTLNALHAAIWVDRPLVLDAMVTRLGNEARLSIALRDVVQKSLHVLFDGLALEQNTMPDEYLQKCASWGGELTAFGYELADQLRILAVFRRALLPPLIQHIAPGPDLELTFSALDAWERAVTAVLAASYVTQVREQLAEGSHQRSVGRLAGGITHSLNNMMAVIIGRAQMLEEQLVGEEQREELRTIQKTARAGADNIKRLQYFATEHDGHEHTRLDVNPIINDVVQLTRFRWRDDAEASGIIFEVAQDLLPVPPVIGQASLLRDALVELILNSVEAMPLGGVITIRSERVADRVQISVIDQGDGMDNVTQVHAIEPFFTTKGPGHAGLGLATVSDLVRQLGGTFSLTSAFGEGTRALLSFPAAAEIRQAGEFRAARLARWARILVVDDEFLVRDVAARTFQRRGFLTVTAASGNDALRVYAAEGPFQVALVDLGMPGMNGFETARALKEMKPRPIVILMTGWASDLDPKKLREVGVDRAISKPFEVDQVLQLIDEALAIREKI